ncbi:MAG: phosphoribosylglycinamide formyltransferase [Fimbriimonadaceae bacterium]|nr:phosphoribosylglycinamide formyltransferase [Fimbriimonadaceae bacterium]
MVRLGVLVSGGGTNLQAILDATADGRIPAQVTCVLADRESAYGLQRAREAGVRKVVVERLPDHPDRDAFSAAVTAHLRAAAVDWVVLAGFLKILTRPFLDEFAGRVVNTHPALLPSFGGIGQHGLHVHRAVLEYGCKVSGCSVHLVDDQVDGGPLIEQVPVPVYDDDTPETLQARILPVEHQALVRVVGYLATGRVTVTGRRVRVAGREVCW